MANIRAMVVELLDGLEDHIGELWTCSCARAAANDNFSERDNLRLLLQYSRKLSAFQNRANLVHKCLEEVLENGAPVLFSCLAIC